MPHESTVEHSDLATGLIQPEEIPVAQVAALVKSRADSKTLVDGICEVDSDVVTPSSTATLANRSNSIPHRRAEAPRAVTHHHDEDDSDEETAGAGSGGVGVNGGSSNGEREHDIGNGDVVGVQNGSV